MRTSILQLTFLILAIFLSLNAASQTQISPKYSVDFDVNTIVTKGDTLIAGGNFNNVGIYTGGAALFTASSDKPNLSFPKLIGSVYGCTPDGQGGYYICGNYRREQETGGYYRIEHILSDYSFEPGFSFTAEFDNAIGITKILYNEGILYIVGQAMINIGGKKVNDLSAIDVKSKKLVSWLPKVSGGVNSIGIYKNTAYIVGGFKKVGGIDRDGIAAIELYTGNIKPWNPGGNWPEGGYSDIAFYKNKVIIGGGFSEGGVPNGMHHACAVVDSTDGKSFQWVFTSDGLFGNGYTYLYWAAGVSKLAVSGDMLYTFSGGTFDTRVTAIDLADSNRIIWAKYFNMIADAAGMAVINNYLYIGGANFDEIYKTDSTNDDDAHIEASIKGLVKLDALTGVLQNWHPDPTGNVTRDVLCMATAGNAIFAGGNFSHVNGLERTGIVMINANTETVLPFKADILYPSVNVLFVQNDTLYAGGDFGKINNQDWGAPAAAFSLKTGELLPWKPLLNGFALSLEASSNYIFLGGRLSEPGGGQDRQDLFAIDKKTGLLSTWAPNPDDDVSALHIENGVLYAGGNFSKISGKSRNFLAGFNLISLNLTGWNPKLDGAVNCINSSDSTIWVGGSFSSVGDSVTGPVAGISAMTAKTKYAALKDIGGTSKTIILKGQYIIAAGSLSTDGQCNDVMLFNQQSKQAAPVTGFCQSFDQGSDIHSIAFTGNDLYIGGEFVNTNGKANATNIERIRFPADFFGTSLPLTLLSFTAELEKENVFLQWQTSHEINTSEFVLQRSINGSRFLDIGTVPAKNNGNAEVSYSFTDAQTPRDADKLYYRLKIVDLDGWFTYSPIRIVFNSFPAESFKVYPNPGYNKIWITSKSLSDSPLFYNLSDISGKEIKTGYLTHSNQTIDISNLAKGVYFLKLVNGAVFKVIKL
ncbi:MAG TPA: T9SS type A sorting domain-containing protein [Chitinophagaceae bacterium]|nr:T9SS type A sorting domain-containing protein [Chitinophagaceae bacterium]